MRSWARNPLTGRALRLEPLERRWLLAADFGDAPAPYPVLLAENGPRHEAIGPLLGATRDTEANGIHSTNATGDGADEDGVTFGPIQVGQLGATLTVNVQGGTGKLDAWIDFDRDGSWGGPLEQIANNQAVAVGNNSITFDVPSWATDGQAIARFRLSTTGNHGVRGAATDGEVEDYAVTIAPPALSSRVFGGKNTINTSTGGAFGVHAADVDGDGDTDILSASFNDDTIAWYENNGSEAFTPHTISTTADGAINVSTADVDGDGDLDVLSASFLDNRIVWYENNGAQAFTARNISTTALGAQAVLAADVDGDGDTDILSASFNDDKIAWYENNGAQTFTERTISTAANGAISVFVSDVDGDGDLDVLSASFLDHRIVWYENNGSQSFATRNITTGAVGAQSVFATDLDGDGDTDVLSASFADDKIAWYENNGNEAFTPRTISTAADGATSVRAADIDGDGDLDVLSASYYDDRIVWYENNGSQSFSARTISSAANGAYSVFAADVDGDGDLDALSASKLDSAIAWYENLNLDYGDAPAPYPTTLAANGARHVTSGPRLGAARDMDQDGQPSANASGDGPDDDGVTFGTIQVGQLGATATVNVQGGNARLDAWIDFNADGSWGGPQEQITNNLLLVSGNNTITFDVPSWASDGPTIARFRLSTAGELGIRGVAADGEAEDYTVTISRPNVGTGSFTDANTISTSAMGAKSVFAADVDGDGDMDVLSASQIDGKIAWYENNGAQTFAAHTITTAAQGAASVVAADLDGDGDVDVLSASSVDDKISWYENNGSQAFTAHTISNTADGAACVFAADIDSDGDLDVLSASASDSKIAWYENNGAQSFTPRTISTAAPGANGVVVADVDSDGDLDVLSSSSANSTIAWYENNGNQVFTRRTITTTASGAQSVFASDVDGDGDTDVLSASFSDNTIAWYENNGEQVFTKRIVTTVAFGATSVFAADMDGDGDVDVLSSSSDDDRITWYENNGSQTFTSERLTRDADSARQVFVADMDGDGDLDVLSASAIDNTIAWYEQIGSASPPHVVAVTVSGSASTHAAHSVPSGSGEQLRTVPVGGMNRVAIQFDANVTVASGDLTISGTTIPNYGIANFAYDSVTFVATWTLTSPVGTDKLTLTLADTVNSSGLALDGEWTNPASLSDPNGSVFPSGNGPAGGAFIFRINVLPGDATRDNLVSGADFTTWADHFDNGLGPADALFAEGDFNGDGHVTGADFTLWADRFGVSQASAPAIVAQAAPLSALSARAVAPPSFVPTLAAIPTPRTAPLLDESARPSRGESLRHVRATSRRDLERLDAELFDTESDWRQLPGMIVAR